MGKFLDALVQRKYNLADEINAIEILLRKSNYNTFSSYETFSNYFLRWPLRNNYINVKSFLDGTGIRDIIDGSKAEECISVDQFKFYVEFVLNMLYYIRYRSKSEYEQYVHENINNLLEQLNLKKHFADEKIHIIEKDILVSESSEILQDTYNLGESVYAYNYQEMSGDLHGKADILCRLYKYFETIEKKASGYGLNSLTEDISSLSNKLDVRHAPTKKQEIVLGSMTQKDIEEWYDELFRLYLSLIILVDYKDRRKDIKELKSKLG